MGNATVEKPDDETARELERLGCKFRGRLKNGVHIWEHAEPKRVIKAVGQSALMAEAVIGTWRFPPPLAGHRVACPASIHGNRAHFETYVSDDGRGSAWERWNRVAFQFGYSWDKESDCWSNDMGGVVTRELMESGRCSKNFAFSRMQDRVGWTPSYSKPDGLGWTCQGCGLFVPRADDWRERHEQEMQADPEYGCDQFRDKTHRNLLEAGCEYLGEWKGVKWYEDIQVADDDLLDFDCRLVDGYSDHMTVTELEADLGRGSSPYMYVTSKTAKAMREHGCFGKAIEALREELHAAARDYARHIALPPDEVVTGVSDAVHSCSVAALDNLGIMVSWKCVEGVSSAICRRRILAIEAITAMRSYKPVAQQARELAADVRGTVEFEDGSKIDLVQGDGGPLQSSGGLGFWGPPARQPEPKREPKAPLWVEDGRLRLEIDGDVTEEDFGLVDYDAIYPLYKGDSQRDAAAADLYQCMDRVELALTGGWPTAPHIERLQEAHRQFCVLQANAGENVQVCNLTELPKLTGVALDGYRYTVTLDGSGLDGATHHVVRAAYSSEFWGTV